MNTNPVQFSDSEMQHFNMVMQMCMNINKKPTIPLIQQMGYTPEQAKRLIYIYKCSNGTINIDSEQDLTKHLRKKNGSDYRITINDLRISNISNVPRVAVVANITQKPFDIYNSKNYKGKDAFYKVVDVSGRKIQVQTTRRPRLEYGQSKKIEGVLEINGLTQDGKAIVTFDRDYAHLCARFIIIASLRNPEQHFGKYTMIAFEGTRVYVYATSMGTGDHVRYSGGTQRVYDYGMDPSTIKPKLEAVAKSIYNELNCVSARYDDSNSRFILVPKTKDELEQERLLEEQQASPW